MTSSRVLSLVFIVLGFGCGLTACQQSLPLTKNDHAQAVEDGFKNRDIFRRADNGGEHVIYTGQSDSRQFRYLTLDNQMPVILIHDPNAKESAAALSISAGSRHDPENYQGLAHFLEHMLFLGSERYPEAGEFSAFVAKNGGYDNAYTSFENTQYFFQINSSALDQGLARFADMFRAPKLEATYMNKEINAVDAEYKSKVRFDSRRIDEATDALLPTGHPLRKLSVGNRETLVNKSVEDQEALLSQLKAFFKTHYSASRMMLAVAGPQDIETLEKYVRHFGGIANNKSVLSRLDFSPVSADLRRKLNDSPLLVVEKIRPGRQVSLRFALDDIKNYLNNHSADYVASILGDEGEASLLTELKNRGWVNALSAGVGPLYLGQAELRVEMSLTPEGLNNVDGIVEQFYRAVDSIRGEINDPDRLNTAKQRYRQYENISQTAIRFMEPVSPVDSVLSAINAVEYYDIPKMIVGNAVFPPFDVSAIEEVLNKITPANSAVVLAGDDISSLYKLDKKTRWYKAAYGLFPLRDMCLQSGTCCAHKSCKKAVLSQNAERQPFLPKLNDYLPNDFSLRCESSNGNRCNSVSGLSPQDQPNRYSRPWGEVYWATDRNFLTPRADISILLEQESLAGKSPIFLARQDVLKSLYIRAINEVLRSKTYQASIAGVDYGISRDRKGIVVRFAGFNDRLPLLVEDVLSAFDVARISAFVEEKAYLDIHRSLKDSLERQTLAAPHKRLASHLTRQILPDVVSSAQKLAALQSVSYQDMLDYAEQFRQAMRAELMLVGNLALDDVIAYERILCRAFPCNLVRPSLAAVQPRLVPVGSGKREWVDAEHQDHASLWYFQSSESGIDATAETWLLAHMLRKPFFKEMRTQRQLGYIVSVGYQPFYRRPGLSLSIQSADYSSEEINAAIQQWLSDLAKTGSPDSPLSEANFDRYKASLLEEISKPPSSVSEWAGRWWGQLMLDDTDFKRRAQLEAALQAMSYPSLMRAVELLLSSGEPSFKLGAKPLQEY